MKRSTILILLLVLVVLVGFLVYYKVYKKQQNNSEKYGYIPGLTPDKVQYVADLIKQGINIAIDKLANMPLNIDPLCPNSTLSTLYLHSDGCEGPIYSTSGGCKFTIPLVGCGCYFKTATGITRVTGLNSLQVESLNNLSTNINYATNACNLTFDMQATCNIKVYGTVKATLFCVDDFIGPDDDYLIETKATVTFENCTMFGNFDGRNLNLSTSTFQVGAVNISLARTDWFSSLPYALKKALDYTLGEIGDLWWSTLDKVLDRINFQSIFQGLIDSLGLNVSIPYTGLILEQLSAWVTQLPASTDSFTIGYWTIAESNGNLAIQLNNTVDGVNFGYCFNGYAWSKCTTSVPTSSHVLPPMIEVGNWFLFSDPKDPNKLVFYCKGSAGCFVLDANGWSTTTSPLSDNMLKVYNSGLNYPCISLNNYRIVQPASQPNSIYVYKRLQRSINGPVWVMSSSSTNQPVATSTYWSTLGINLSDFEKSGSCSSIAVPDTKDFIGFGLSPTNRMSIIDDGSSAGKQCMFRGLGLGKMNCMDCLNNNFTVPDGMCI